MLEIVLTGGPCSGKTVACGVLIQLLEARGFKVFTPPEQASIFILNGICPSAKISMEEFQNFIIDGQLATENLFRKAAEYYDPDKVIIFYDRGLLDGGAYVERDYLANLLAKRNISFADAYNRYDAVFHLVTAADGAEAFYQWNDPTKADVGNNAARSESPAEAREKDKKTLNAWIGHPHLRVFDNSTDFDGKIKRVVEEVFALLGEPVPSEIERKFLIKKPTAEQIAALGCVSETNIIQTYLKNNGNATERRIRQRGTRETGYSFFYTEKTDVSSGVRIENERKITPDEYLELLTEADTSLHQISKTRHCFVYKNRYFELDIYPFSDEYAILEIELNDIDEEFELPPLDVVCDVTDDIHFRNSALAETLSFNLESIDAPVKTVTTTEWIYETGRDEPEILGSGSHTYNVVRTKDEDEAFRLSKECARNYISRSRKVNGEKVYQWYDPHSKSWIE